MQRVADLLSKQRPEARNLFRYALVLAMIDEEKAHILGTRVEGDHENLTDQTIAGDGCEIERPPIDDAGIRLVRSGLDPRQIQEFWHYLHDDLEPAALKAQSILVFNRLVGYARASIQARANR